MKTTIKFASQFPIMTTYDMYMVRRGDEQAHYCTVGDDGYRTLHTLPEAATPPPIIRGLSREELQNIANALKEVGILAEGEVPAKNELALVKEERDLLRRKVDELTRAIYTQLPKVDKEVLSIIIRE